MFDGSILWHWQSIVAGAYVGVVDNRSLVLQFKRSSSDSPFIFVTVFSAQNIELPEGMPFGMIVNG